MAVGLGKMLGYIIGVVFGLIVVGILLPIGIEELLTANWTGTGLDASLITMITVLIPVCVILGVVIAFLPKLKKEA